MNNAGSVHDSASELLPMHSNPWNKLPALCDELVDSGVINDIESAIIRKWLSADRWSGKHKGLDRVDQLVSTLLSEGRISDDERGELFAWLDRCC